MKNRFIFWFIFSAFMTFAMGADAFRLPSFSSEANHRGNTKDEESSFDAINDHMRWRDLIHGVYFTPDPIGYGDGPNRYCYVHCNPITKFDPLGLSWWNPVTRDFALYNAGRNTGRHLSAAGSQLKSGHPVDAARWLYGAPASILTGDLFDEKNPVNSGDTAVSVNGIFNNDTDADNLRKKSEQATGQQTHAVKNGTHFLGIGDLFQTVFEATGAKTTPSLNYADAVNKIANNHPGKTLESTQHSQGGSVGSNGSTLIDPAINSLTSVQTFGAQLGAKNDGTFLNVYNQRSSGGLIGDPVPYLDPRNWGNHLRGDIYGNPNASGHSWEKNYGEGAVRKAEASEIFDEMLSL